VGDFSLPTGGPFGREYGGPGHSSHQNGLDVDVYYPRIDQAETVVGTRFEANFVVSQELVERFVAAGAYRVFVGRRTPLRGPTPTVQRLALHENHLHVRFSNPDQPVPATVTTVTTVRAMNPTTTVVPPVSYPSCDPGGVPVA
jgi:murein endopeptidase